MSAYSGAQFNLSDLPEAMRPTWYPVGPFSVLPSVPMPKHGHTLIVKERHEAKGPYKTIAWHVEGQVWWFVVFCDGHGIVGTPFRTMAEIDKYYADAQAQAAHLITEVIAAALAGALKSAVEGDDDEPASVPMPRWDGKVH